MVGKAAVLFLCMLQTSERRLDNPWELAYAPTIIPHDHGEGRCGVAFSWRRGACMTKTELVDKVAAAIQLPKHQTETVVNLFLQCITDALRAGDKVELRGFGSFRLRHRAPRTGRNPKTGDTVQIPAKQVPWFKAGKALRMLVDSPPAVPDQPRTRSAQGMRRRVRSAEPYRACIGATFPKRMVGA